MIDWKLEIERCFFDKNGNISSRKLASVKNSEVVSLINSVIFIDIPLVEKVYLLYNDVKLQSFYCESGNKFRFISFLSGYNTTCVARCSSCSKKSAEKMLVSLRRTNLERYGVEYSQQTDRVKNLLRESYQNKTSDDIQSINEKRKQTCLQRYGCDNVSYLVETQDKIRETNKKRYGVNNPLQSEEVKETIKKTCLEKYGTEYAIQSDTVRMLLKSVYQNKTSDDIQSINEKRKQTCLRKFGAYSNSQEHFSSIIHLIEDQDWWNQWSSFGEVKDFLLDYMTLTTIYKKAHQYRSDWDFSNISSPHQRINTLLDSLGIEYVTNTKQIIAPLELDIHIPSHNLAIEVNGLYWHSELAGNKPKDYHLNKFLQCQSKGIRLLQFWDSEINNDWSTAELIIKGYLGSGSVEIEEGINIIYNDNRFPWDYSELGFTLVEQTEPRCWYTDYNSVYEEPGNGRYRIWDCGFSVFYYPL